MLPPHEDRARGVARAAHVLELPGKLRSPRGSFTGTSDHVVVSSLDGSERVNVSGWVAYSSVWSPDGTSVAFVRTVTQYAFDNYEVFVVRADGTDLHSLDLDRTEKSALAWSPDGTTIALSSKARRCRRSRRAVAHQEARHAGRDPRILRLVAGRNTAC